MKTSAILVGISSLMMFWMNVVLAQSDSLLDGSDQINRPHSMYCLTKEDGWVLYEIRGESLYYDNEFFGDIVENDGEVFTTELSTTIGEVTIVIDYKNRTVINNYYLTETFYCN